MSKWESLDRWWTETGSLWWERIASVLARPAIAVLAIVTMVLYLAGSTDLKGAAVIFFGGLVVFVALTPPQRWKGLSDRFESFKLSGFGLGVEAKRAAAQTPESEAEAPAPEAAPEPEVQVDDVSVADVMALRFKFEAKFAYIVKHLLNEEAKDEPLPSEFATVGSLRHDGYLTDAQAQLAAGIQTMREGDLVGLSASERRKFFEEADDFVTNMRASVFDGMVRKRLLQEGWNVSDLKRSTKSARPDILLAKGEADAPQFVIAPTYAMRLDSEILARAEERLGPEGEDRDRLAVERRIVVVPNRSEVTPTGNDTDPQVLKLSGLPGSLQ